MWIKWVSSWPAICISHQNIFKRERRGVAIVFNLARPCRCLGTGMHAWGGGGSLMQVGVACFIGQILWRWAVPEQWTTWWWKSLTKRLEGIPTSWGIKHRCLFIPRRDYFRVKKGMWTPAELPENLGFICFCFDKKATKVVFQPATPISCHKFFWWK